MKDSQMLLADLVTTFFTRHLAAELNASAHTIASYRDSFCLLLNYLSETRGRAVSKLGIDDLQPDAILGFLSHLEQQRGNTVRTRNARLAAIRSFFGFAMSRVPSVAALGHRVIAIPFKKGPTRLLGYLGEDELRAILAGPDRSTTQGRRDYLLLALLYDTGTRVQELLTMRPIDFRLDRLPLVRVEGKGRKPRVVPLLPASAQLVRQFLKEHDRSMSDALPLFLNYRRAPLTRSGVTFVLQKYLRQAATKMPALRRAISPHTLRHTKAMHLLQAGVSPVTIKDILGHAHLKTLEIYVQADLEMKRAALEAVNSSVKARRQRFRNPDLLSWLEHL